MSDSANAIVDDFLSKGWPSNPQDRTIDLVKASPNEATTIVLESVRRISEYASFVSLACDFVPMQDWPRLIAEALDKIEAGDEEGPAHHVIAAAAMQCLPLLHPHLDRIFRIRPVKDTYSEFWPWRDSGTTHFDALARIVKDQSADLADRPRAWKALLETRTPEAVKLCIATYQEVGPAVMYGKNPLENFLLRAGIGARADKTLHKLEQPHRVLHMQFDPSYWKTENIWPKVHPTYAFPPSKVTARFGGASEGACNCCGNPLHHLITLDPVPTNLGIKSLNKVTFATCLTCLGWDREMPMFCEHDADGKPRDMIAVAKKTPEFPAGPLVETTVHLVETPARWHWQDWGLASNSQNFNRLGGHPSWIQDADFPVCPWCNVRMKFIFQLGDSLMSTSEAFGPAKEWQWGSGGNAYVCWCDACKVSGTFWQCT
jgi:hypothetical protein